MKLNLELNESDLEELLLLYTKIKPMLQGITMPESIYELNCDACGSEYELTYIEHEDSEQPIYCPFCGSDIDLTDVEDESFDEDFDLDELDFEND
jgi:rRNA maturation endonuclease Nob1